MSEERTEDYLNQTLRPYGTIPAPGVDYPIEEYAKHIVDNLLGPLRQYRAAMLDLGNLVTTDPSQRRVFRNVVFQKHEEFASLLRSWCFLYGLNVYEVQEAIIAEMERQKAEED